MHATPQIAAHERTPLLPNAHAPPPMTSSSRAVTEPVSTSSQSVPSQPPSGPPAGLSNSDFPPSLPMASPRTLVLSSPPSQQALVATPGATTTTPLPTISATAAVQQSEICVEVEDTNAADELPRKAAAHGSTLLFLAALPARCWLHLTLLNAGLLAVFAAHMAHAVHARPPLFLPHLLLAATWVVLSTNATVLLQHCARTPLARAARRAHAALQLAAITALVGCVSWVFLLRHVAARPHFSSTHAKLGLATFVTGLLATLVGALAHWMPRPAFGSAAAARVYGLWPHVVLGAASTTVTILVVSEYSLAKWYSKAFSPAARAASDLVFVATFVSIMGLAASLRLIRCYAGRRASYAPLSSGAS